MSERRSLLQESLAAIERLQARLDASERAKHEPIAIIGAGCRYPGGIQTPDDFWHVLRDGVDAVSEVPRDRWDPDAYYDPDPQAPGKMVTRRGGFLTQVDAFDAQFFGISPREAATMDPQQRLLLETAAEALESAGVASDRLAGSATGVFVGITTSDYGQLLRLGGPEHSDVYSATGSALNAAAGRVSYTFGFQGPCVAVDTACSSSLVAVHLACQSLRTGESDLALAGGVNVILSPDAMVLFSKWGMMAPDGACKTFDAAADGFVRAEGCAMIALKRLTDAQAAGDPILAVIRGSAVNSDGRSSGLTVPNGPAQQSVIRRALASAGLQPADIDYVEAHGTGTPLGDPIEIEALGTVMKAGRRPDAPLKIGSVKTNLGHTEAASGLAGLLKVVMALRHDAIPPHLHFSTPNPGIPWADLPLSVPTTLTPWPRSDRPRRAGVSSFGFSGTNAHVILEEAPAPPETSAGVDEPCVFVLSARSEPGLRAVVRRHAEYLTNHPHAPLSDLSATLATGRAHYEKRLAFVADSSQEVLTTLSQCAAGEWPAGVAAGTLALGERPKVAFLFTGQGSQYAGMSRALYESAPVFRNALDTCAAILNAHLDRPLLEVLFPPPGGTCLINETAYTQPALFAVEYALAELWRSWGITPSIVCGHSVGEYVAACVAGVFSLEDGLALIAERGRLMQALPSGGAMAAVFANESDVASRMTGGMSDRLAIAAVNGPEETVVSGDADAVMQLLQRCADDGIKGRALEVSHAFHSARLEPMLDAFEKRATVVQYGVPRIPLVSNLTGDVFPPGAHPDARYWRRHARETVRFSRCIEALSAAKASVLVEIGPHPTLLGMVARVAPRAQWTTTASLRRGRDDRREMLASVGALHLRGAQLNWDAVIAGRSDRRLALPTYPFQRERHWVEKPSADRPASASGGHPLLGTRQLSPHPGSQFLAEVGCDSPAFLAEHDVLGHVLLPGTAYVEMALAAARSIGGDGAVAIRALAIESPLRLEPDVRTRLHLEVGEPAGGSASFVVRSTPASAPVDSPWRVHARGTIHHGATVGSGPHATLTVAHTRERCATSIDATDYYARLERVGLSYGPTFKGLRALYIGRDEGVGFLDVAVSGNRAQWTLHPALLDAAFHVLGGVLLDETAPQDAPDHAYVPIGIEEVWVAAAAPTRVWVAARIRSTRPSSVRIADLRIEDEAGQLVALITGLQIRAITADSIGRALSLPGIAPHTYTVGWQTARGLESPVSPKGDRYLLIADSGGCAMAIAQALREKGAMCSVIPRADLEGESALSIHLRSESGTPLAWIIDCTALDSTESNDPLPVVHSGYGHLLDVAKGLAATGAGAGLCVVTRGAQAAAPGDEVSVSQASLLGLARTIASERVDAPMARLDLDPSALLDAEVVLRVLGAASAGEPELAIRNGEVLAPRLQESIAPSTRNSDDGKRDVVRIRARGTLDALHVQSEARRTPGPGEVEIGVRAAGLNFRDVLNTLDMYPGDAGPLGSECSGVVLAVGEGVTHVRTGDEVVALAVDSMASHVTSSAAMVVRKPECMSFGDAVTVPNAYLTAAQSFRAAGLAAGQRVLIHAAAGGVGLAALRLARRAGAEVIATAGSARKRAVALEEGASHAFDSRSPTFADDVLRVTGGTGVDVVLNSLAGEFITAGMRCVRPGGVFVEIGKGGIWSVEEAARRAPGVRYVVIDLGDAIRDDAPAIRHTLEEILLEVAQGKLAALPLRTFPLSEAVAAFRYMAAARHVGKVVLLPKPADVDSVPVRADGTYLVTGGLGGLGLATAQWLVRRGAQEIVLVSRRSPTSEDDSELERLRASGARVTVASCDVGDRESLQFFWRDTLAQRPPLRGIVHAAGVVSDAPLDQQDAARFTRVAQAKISGAWHLHELSSQSPLDFFVLYSSASALFGSAGQANYAAANSFLDGLAAFRQARGLCATSIGWGAWAQVGMAARTSEANRARWARLGIGLLDPADAFPALERALQTRATHVAIVALDPQRVGARPEPGVRALFGHVGGASAALAHAGAERTDAGADRSAHQRAAGLSLARLQAAPGEARPELVRTYLRAAAAHVLGFAPERLDPTMPLSSFGFDSLMAVQLKNRIEADLNSVLPIDEFLQGLTVDQLSVSLLQTMEMPAPFAALSRPTRSTLEGQNIPLSFQQQRLWFLDQLTPGSSTYVIPWSLRWRGRLDLAVLERSLAEIVRRHESLRTVFRAVDGIASQVILPPGIVSVPVIDLAHLPPQEREAEAWKLTASNASESFDLTIGPLLCVRLVRLDAADHVLLIAIHHAVFDGSSFAIFARELSAIYQAYLDGMPSPLPELGIQYADFSQWQRQHLDSAKRESERAYWNQELGGHSHPLELPVDRPRSAVHSPSGRCHRQLDARLTGNLRLLSQKEGVSLFMVLLSVFEVLMHRLSGQKEFLVGTPVAGRNRTETESLIGFFVNTVVMHADFAQALSFRQLLAHVRRVALEAFEHQDMPFEELVGILEPHRDLNRSPLFQVFFNHLNVEAPRLEIEGATVEPFGEPTLESKFDLTLYSLDKHGLLDFTLLYDQDLFDKVRADEMLEQYSSLLAQICEDPDGSVEGFSLLTESMRARVPDASIALESRDYESIVDRLRTQAAAHPNRVAVEDVAGRWSYAELERLSGDLAGWLRSRDVRRGDVVGIYGHRSAPFVLALVGVLRAGAAFCVFDPSYPAARLCQNLRAARPKAWIQIAAAGSPPESVRTLLTELVGERQVELPRSVELAGISPHVAEDLDPGDQDAPAYVTFTSGTTGQPKCVWGTNRPLSHFLEWHCANFGLTANDRFSMLSGLGHDPLLRDVFTPLWLGATLCIPKPEEILTPGYLTDWMHGCQISVTHLTPAMGTLVAESATRQLPALRHVFFGGDTLTPRVTGLVHRISPAAQIVNFYGTTETPQAMAWHRVDPPPMVGASEHATNASGHIPIGKSIPDVQLLILNRTRGLAGAGELGELFVRTPYLTLGYANDRELTSQRFVANPITGDKRDLLYRTGDMARYRPDGLVEFVGREDQVKVRGYRVELGEVEVALIAHKDVAQCVVTASKDPHGAPRLVAYVVRTSGSAPTPLDLRTHLATVLPEYMIPSAFVFLESIPLTPNGKIDRRALPIPSDESDSGAKGDVAPRSAVEAALAEIWARVLGVKTVSVFSDFFELGGHSLLATQLIARMKAELGIDLPLRSLFVEPTIAGLSTRIVFNESTQAYQYVEDNKHPWKRLVPAQTKGSRIPFFFVAGYMDADDTLRVLSHIIPHLGIDQPVYGFQPRWLDGSSESYSSVEEVASEFVTELRSFQPEGPYFLGGDCASGVIALEMARELRRQGAEVGILVMFDTERPSVLRDRGADLRLAFRRARHIGETVWEILSSDFREKKRIVRELYHRKMLARQPQKEREATESEADRVNRLRTDYRRMVYRHRVEEYPGPITLFICEHIYRFDKNLGWARAAPGGLEVHVVPGDHWTRYTAHGKEFSALLDGCFRRVQRQIAERSEHAASGV